MATLHRDHLESLSGRGRVTINGKELAIVDYQLEVEQVLTTLSMRIGEFPTRIAGKIHISGSGKLVSGQNDWLHNIYAMYLLHRDDGTGLTLDFWPTSNFIDNHFIINPKTDHSRFKSEDPYQAASK